MKSEVNPYEPPQSPVQTHLLELTESDIAVATAFIMSMGFLLHNLWCCLPEQLVDRVWRLPFP
ncbi:MAG: hypothetical protein IH991_24360 [Planctomycetes bacterium]|nr:hypothetical protein [Planctomycetota bacterium]